MKPYEERVQFQGSTQSQGFRPIEGTDVIPLLRQNQQTEQQNFTRQREAKLQELDANKLTNLSKFSETLSTFLVEEGKRKAEKDEEEGLQFYYTHGVPEETTKQFDQGVAQLTAVDSKARIMGSEYQTNGGDQFVAEQIRSLSGWKKFGYQKGAAQDAGIKYPSFYTQAAADTKVTIQTENGPREVTMDSALTPPERAAVEAEIRGKYLSQFKGVNPALLNKYLFPQMRAHEAKESIEWGERRAAVQKEQRKAEAQDALWTGIQSGQGGETLVEFIQQRQGDFGGLGNTRKAAAEIIRGLIKDRKIGQTEVDAILGHQFVANDGSTVTVGKYWGRDFDGIKDEIYNASRADLQQEITRKADQSAAFKLKFEEATAEKRAQGKDWTEAELLALSDDYASKGLGESPDWLKNAASREDRDDKADRDHLLEVYRSRTYLTEEDLHNVSPKVYQEMRGYIKQPSEESKVLITQANKKIESITSLMLQENEGKKDHTPKYWDTIFAAQAGYSSEYKANLLKGMLEPEAHSNAMKTVEDNIKAGIYSVKPSTSVNQARQLKFSRVAKAVSTGTDLNSVVLPGTEGDIKLLEQYATTGKGSIPEIYNQLARIQPRFTAWDIADAQLKAAGKGSLIRPKAQQFVDKQDPIIQRLLNWRPTTARTTRVAMNVGWKPLLDLVASKESLSYGEYDAMNTGGSQGGTVAYGSANSTNVFGRGLSSMTVREVMELQNKGKVHAAGRYQIIGSTLKGLISRGVNGVTADSLFDTNTQDALATSLAKSRIAAGNSLTGLRNEWIGLQKVPDATLQNAINNINVPSPFNNPDNLLPRLVYRIGSRGYGSTGPHLDVKPVSPGTLQSNKNLPPISMKDLDPYIRVGGSQKVLSQGTTTTDNDAAHRGRNSFGHDFAAPNGTPVYLTNGARVVGTFKGDGGTDHTIIQLPDGKRYQFLHGTNA